MYVCMNVCMSIYQNNTDNYVGHHSPPIPAMCVCRLSGCCISEVGCEALGSALGTKCSTLKELDLTYNFLGDKGRDLLQTYNLKTLRYCKVFVFSVVCEHILHHVHLKWQTYWETIWYQMDPFFLKERTSCCLI